MVGQRIADLRPVERDDGDAVADCAEQFICAGIDGDFACRHSASPISILLPSLRRAKRRSNPAFFPWHGLLRFARNDSNVWRVTLSKLLHPGPQFHLPGPGAARLL